MGDDKKHALLSPSAAVRWLTCPGSVRLTKDINGDAGSTYAREGTAAHSLAELCLRTGGNAADHLGTSIEVEGDTFIVDDEMAEAVQVYLDKVRDLAEGNDLSIEVKLPLEHLTGEEGAEGTSDAVVLIDYGDGTGEVVVIDYKHGKGKRVDEREQLNIYALAAAELFGLTIDITHYQCVIVQPRLDHIAQWGGKIEELHPFKQQVQATAKLCMSDDAPLVPSTKGCQWCKAKAQCPAIGKLVIDEFEHVQPVVDVGPDRIAVAYSKIDLIRSWCDAVEAEMFEQVKAGKQPQYKLVAGRAGARAWTDDTAVEAAMKAMRLKQDEMYSMKLISPTQAEKVLKDNPRRWSKLQSFVTQPAGKPTVAPITDKRPALVMQADAGEFDDETAGGLL